MLVRFGTKENQRSYKNATNERVFCSLKCGAAYGLLQFGVDSGEQAPDWCRIHGKWSMTVIGDDGERRVDCCRNPSTASESES